MCIPSLSVQTVKNNFYFLLFLFLFCWKSEFIYSFGQNWEYRNSPSVSVLPKPVLELMGKVKQKPGKCRWDGLSSGLRVAAGAILTPSMKFPGRSLILGPSLQCHV
jgi:hypothetical protein